MIIIERPTLQEFEGKTKISCAFTVNGESRILWYFFDKQFSKYLVTERTDAFLVALLLLGLKTGNDISIKGAVSARLYYTIKNHLIEVLCKTHSDFSRIEIFPEMVVGTDLNFGGVAGTGCSGGIDSFATILSHKDEEGAFKIKYFTFFNAGSHGDLGGENSRKLHEKRLKNVSEIASNYGQKVITVDSNISEVLEMNFQSTHTFRNISCVLNLQKLFKNYYYASTYSLEQFKLDSLDAAYFDLFSLNMLSTESTNFFSSNPTWNRVEKTLFVSNFSETYDHLEVCTDLQNFNGRLNCTSCDKCLRTALTLELLDKLHFYENVIDLQKFRNKRESFIGKVMATRKESSFNYDLWLVLKERGQFTFISYIYCFRYNFKQVKKSLKKRIKTFFKTTDDFNNLR